MVDATKSNKSLKTTEEAKADTTTPQPLPHFSGNLSGDRERG